MLISQTPIKRWSLNGVDLTDIYYQEVLDGVDLTDTYEQVVLDSVDLIDIY